MAILTTPRSAAVALPIAIWQFCLLIRNKRLLILIPYLIIPFLSYFVWVELEYGSIGEFINYFKGCSGGLNRETSLISNFVGGNFIIEWYHIPLLLVLLGAFLYRLITRCYGDSFLFLLPIVTFFTIVKDTGMYGVFFLAFVYLYVIDTIQIIPTHSKVVRVLLWSFVAVTSVINCGVHTFKLFGAVSSLEKRNEHNLEEFVASLIPKGSLVVANYAHYYAIVNNGCTFKTIWQEGKSYQRNMDELKSKYLPQYIIVSDTDRALNEICVKNFKCQIIGQYIPSSDDNFLVRMVKKVGISRIETFFKDSYSCNVYQIVYDDLLEHTLNRNE